MPRSRRLSIRASKVEARRSETVAVAQEPGSTNRPAASRVGGRPPQSMLTFDRRPLSRFHSIFLALTGVYLCAAYPAGVGPVLLVVTAGILAELTPVAWRRFFFAEIVSLCSCSIAFGWALHIDGGWPQPRSLQDYRGAFLAWVRVLLVIWTLVPSRPGFLRLLAVLLGIETCIIGSVGHNALDYWAALILIPLAAAALAADAAIRIGACCAKEVHIGAAARRSFLTWSWPVLLVVCSTALLASAGIMELKRNLQPGAALADELPRLFGERMLQRNVALDGKEWKDSDPAVVARLIPPQGLPQDNYYLRAYTAPELSVDGPDLVWTAAGEVEVLLEDGRDLHDGHSNNFAVLNRYPGIGDMILMPDGCRHVELPNLRADRDGNLSRPDFGEIQRWYEVDLGAISRPPLAFATAPMDGYLDMPPQLRELLWELVPELADWRMMPPNEAAGAIRSWLHGRCRYDIDDLPDAETGYCANLVTFLADEDADERRGHCQYFASAMTLLLRCAGHPTRVVVGFSSDEVLQEGVVFRSFNAHAWIEFLVRQGGEQWWTRFEATPSVYNEVRRPERLDDDPFGDRTSADEARERSRAQRAGREQLDWKVVLPWAGGGLLLLLGWLVWRSRRRSPDQALADALHRQTADLVSLALQMGISVQPHMTLTALAAEVEARTGCDLQAHLQAHLRARFGGGPLPEPWPVADLRAAWRERQQARSRRPAQAVGSSG